MSENGVINLHGCKTGADAEFVQKMADASGKTVTAGTGDGTISKSIWFAIGLGKIGNKGKIVTKTPTVPASQSTTSAIPPIPDTSISSSAAEEAAAAEESAAAEANR